MKPRTATKALPAHPSPKAPARGADPRHPVSVVRAILDDRKSKNPHYSLNAFARDLGLTSSLLSRILNRTRPLTLKQGMHIAAMLGFSTADTNAFVLSIIENASDTAKISKKLRERIRQEVSAGAQDARPSPDSPLYLNYDIERFKAIAQWYHLPILNLTFIEGFEATPEYVSQKLGISTAEAGAALDRLLELGFLEEGADGQVRKSQTHIYFKTDRSELAMREHQSQMMDRAKQEMRKTTSEDFARRMINGISFACAPEHIPLLKKKMDEFQDEVLALTRNGPHREVYQLNCQLFPVTAPDSNSKEKSK